jgi:hypothetical protein
MPNVLNYNEQGGARDVIGGSLDVVSGGELDIESGGAFKIAGTQMTASAADLNATAAVNGAVTKFATAPLPIAADTNSHDTTIIIPQYAVIKNVYLKVAVAEATGTTKTLIIGISGGDEDGFLAGVSVGTIGTIKGTLANGAVTLGALQTVDTDGVNAVVKEDYVCSAATTIAYTLVAADYEEMVANVVVEYMVLT